MWAKIEDVIEILETVRLSIEYRRGELKATGKLEEIERTTKALKELDER